MTTSSRVSAAVTAVLAGAAYSAPAVSADDQGPLQEVTVTAQKRSENMQDVALSISALTGADLETKGAAGFRDWAQYVPGVTMYQGTSANRRAGPTAVIRGVSQTGGGQLNEVSSMATSTYMIGQLPIFSGDPGLFDLNRVEILRGPQGTLFGIASMGGTIRFIPNEAKLNDFAAEIGLGSGMIYQGGNSYDLDAMVNVPLIQDKLAIRFAAIKRRNDGYIDMIKLPMTANNPNQIFVDGDNFDPRLRDGDNIIHDANTTETTGVRVSLKWTPTEKFAVNTFTMWQKGEQGTKQAIDFNDESDEWIVSRFALEPQKDEFVATSIEASYDVGFGSVEYVGGYFDSSMSETIDVTTLITSFLDGTGANAAVKAIDRDGPGGLPPDPWPSATQFPFESDTEIITNELRLQGTEKSLGFSLFGAEQKIDYVLGVFRMTEDRLGTFRVANPTWNANRGPNTVPILTEGGLMTGQQGGGGFETKAVFGDLTFHLTEKLSLGAGVRYSDSERDSALFGYGDAASGRAANGATVGTDLSGPPVSSSFGRVSDNAVTPRYTAKYRFDDQRMVFATAAKGQRMPSSFANPTFWTQPNAPSNPVCRDLAQTLGVYDDAESGTTTDEVWSYDLGLKSTWLDRRLQVNTSVYMLDWDNLQRNVQLSQFNGACNILIPANVGKVEIKGFELEMIYVPVDSVTLNVAVGYTDAQVGETVAGVNDSLGRPLEKGDAIENVAPWTASVGAEVRFTLGALNSLLGTESMGFARVDWRYADERLGTNIGDRASLSADPIRSQFISDPYDLTDIRLGLNNDSWSASLYVSNVFNDKAMFESFRQTWLPNQRIVSVNQPRTVGFTVKKRF